MSQAIVVRATVPRDIPRITEIYAREVLVGRASFETEPPGDSVMLDRYQALLAGGYGHLVACRGETVLGYAYTSSYRPRAAYRHTVEDSVYVAPEARGCGVATSLLSALIEDCRAKPFRQMIAVIGDSANTASVALHEKLGFRHVGVLSSVGYKFDTWLDTVLMQRAV